MSDISGFSDIGLEGSTYVGINASTNTNPMQQLAIINAGKNKKKPIDININKINKKAGKITRKSNERNSDKQNFRIYKSKVAPNLYSKIMVDEEDDIVAKIKEAFGIEDKKNTNFTNVETAQDYVKAPPAYEPPEEPNSQFKESEINQINSRDYPNLLGLNLRFKDIMQDWDRRQSQYAKPFFFPHELQAGQSSSQLSLKTTKKPLKYTPEEASNLLKFNIKKRLSRLGASQAKADLRYALNRFNDPDYKEPTGEYLNLAITPGSKYLDYGNRPAYTAEVAAKLEKQAKDFYAKQNAEKPKKRGVGRPKGSKTDNSPSAVAERKIKRQNREYKRRMSSNSK